MITTPHTMTAHKPPLVQIRPAILAAEDAAAYLSISVRTMQTLVASGQLAKPRKISPGRVGWLVQDLDTFATSRPVADELPPPNTSHRKGVEWPFPKKGGPTPMTEAEKAADAKAELDRLGEALV